MRSIGYGETAIAEAARPALGDAGFTIMAIAALLATSSSVNATLYASGGLTAMLAQVGQFPTFFGRSSRLGPHAGLLITSALVLVIANLVDLSAIASVGSAISLVIFLLVGVAAYRLRAEIGALVAVVLAAIALTALVLVFFAIDTLRNSPETFTAIVAITVLAVLLDVVWKRLRQEPPTATADTPLTPSAKKSNRNEGTRQLTTNAVGTCRQAGRGADGRCAVDRVGRVVARIEPLLPRVQRRFRYPGRKRLRIGRRCRGSCSCSHRDRVAASAARARLRLGLDLLSPAGRWQQAGVWERLHGLLLAELRAAGEIEWSRAVADPSTCRQKRGRRDGPEPG